ncbi:hypothetical protein [Desulfonatronum parangueonense]
MAHELENIEEMLDRISAIEGDDDRISLGVHHRGRATDHSYP